MSADIVIELPPREAPPVPDSVQFIGTATVLIRYAGLTVLTDPNFLHRGQFAYLGKGLVSRRLTEPALAVTELPDLDLIVLSHLHGDHFDRVAKAGLDRSVPILTTVPAASRLNRWGFRALPLRTWQEVSVRRSGSVLRVTALPARHAKGIARVALPTVMGSLLDFGGEAPPLRMYLTGDTLLHDELRQIRARYDDIDVAVLHLGGTRILGMLVTMDGEQGVQMLRLVQPQAAIPVHYDDYGVFKSPLADFLAAVRRDRPPVRIVSMNRGDVVPLPVPVTYPTAD